MEILLIEPLVPEARAWLEVRHATDCRPELADDPAALQRELQDTRALVLPRKMVVTRDFLARCPRLRALARTHAGSDNTDLEACRERHVEVIQAGTAHVRSNAEYLLAALLMLYRRGIGMPVAGHRHAEVRLGRELYGSAVGLLGLSPTAHSLAVLLRGLDVRLVGYDPQVPASSPVWSRLKIRPVTLKELAAHSDAVSVQMNFSPRLRGFIDGQVLAHCKRGQLWVGISRSALFDGPALSQALADGRIEACLLDGAEAGFASKGSSLHEADNLFLTPRLGSYTRQARMRASWYLAHRLHEALKRSPRAGGDPPRADHSLLLGLNR